MSKIIRNTIIISSIWVFTIIVGVIYIYGHQKRTLSKLQTEVKNKSERLDELKRLKNDLSELQDYYNHLKQISLKYKGTLASFVSPGETFDYIRRELAHTNSSIKLNMEFVSEEPYKNMIRRTYKLSGSGKFKDIYNFLWFLENGPVFYSIQSLNVEKLDESAFLNDPTLQPDESTFNFTLIGYDRKEGPKITEINRQFGEPKKIADLFNDKTKPKSKKIKPVQKSYTSRKGASPSGQLQTSTPKNSRKLPEINSKCKVLAITPFTVLIRDSKGKIIKLRKGDEIFGGKLTTIDASKGKAIFEYSNNFGYKTVVLTIEK